MSAAVIAVFVAAGAFLAWQIVTRGISGTFWESAPELVLALRGDHARSLVKLAETRLSTDSTGADADLRAEANELQILGERALKTDPLNVAAIRILGLAAERAGNKARASELMAIAGQRSIRDPATSAWLMRKSLEEENFAEALRHADSLLRTEPDVRDRLLPILVAIASHPKGSPEMIARLATNPPWRSWFLTESAMPTRRRAP